MIKENAHQKIVKLNAIIVEQEKSIQRLSEAAHNACAAINILNGRFKGFKERIEIIERYLCGAK